MRFTFLICNGNSSHSTCSRNNWLSNWSDVTITTVGNEIIIPMDALSEWKEIVNRESLLHHWEVWIIFKMRLGLFSADHDWLWSDRYYCPAIRTSEWTVRLLDCLTNSWICAFRSKHSPLLGLSLILADVTSGWCSSVVLLYSIGLRLLVPSGAFNRYVDRFSCAVDRWTLLPAEVWLLNSDNIQARLFVDSAFRRNTI